MSPIKGISDRPRLPRLGKIRLGVKVEEEGKKPFPRATSHFVCPPEVQAVLGEKPTSLPIAFPTDDPDQWASHYYRRYSSFRGLTCRGDGEKATRWVDLEKAVDKATGELPTQDQSHPRFWPVASRETKQTIQREIDCPPLSCQEFGQKQCKPVLNLQFMLPDVEGIGIWQLDTSSWNSIRNVLAGLNLVKGLTKSVLGVPRLQLIPLTLALVPLQVQPEGVKKTVHVLRLTAPYKLADLLRHAKLPAGESFILPPPDLEPPDDLFPEEEPTEPPVEATVESFFQEDEQPAARQLTEAEERAATWVAIKGVLAKGVVKPHQLVAWLRKEANVAIALPDVDKPEAPSEVPTPALRRLHDALAQYQLKLEAHA